MAHGKMVYHAVGEPKPSQMVMFTLESGSMVKHKAKEQFNNRMEDSMKEPGRKIWNTDKERRL